jgi:hypothetical protein
MIIFRRKVKYMKNILSIDAETNGLYGDAFAIGAILYSSEGHEVARFVGRLPDGVVTSDWVKENVLPQLRGMEIKYSSYTDLLKAFYEFYMEHRNAIVIGHMIVPVEAKLFIDAQRYGFIGEFDGPYPFIDISDRLEYTGFNPTSVDEYVEKFKLEIGDFQGGTHNPLYDAAAAAAVYFHLNKK